MQTDCALTDFYCQCGKNVKFIQEKTIACLCTSECTTGDLASTLPHHSFLVRNHQLTQFPQRSTLFPTSSARRPSPTTARPTSSPLPSPPASAMPMTPLPPAAAPTAPALLRLPAAPTAPPLPPLPRPPPLISRVLPATLVSALLLSLSVALLSWPSKCRRNWQRLIVVLELSLGLGIEHDGPVVCRT